MQIKYLQDFRDTSVKLEAVDGKIFKAINAPFLNSKNIGITRCYFCFFESKSNPIVVLCDDVLHRTQVN